MNIDMVNGTPVRVFEILEIPREAKSTTTQIVINNQGRMQLRVGTAYPIFGS
jgi:hypothetical protein